MSKLFFIGFLLTAICLNAQTKTQLEKVFLDKNGVIRWQENKQEVALFGANYCLPSACDYRAAGYISSDRKKMVDQDMVHFARMGWDALRLCLWGDWENTDKEGNLVNNDHLDLMDYVIAKARTRGIYFLLSPIVTYSSLWPDANRDTSKVDGISKHYRKSELGTNPKAIAAQQNYLKQLLNHVNPYTGVALKDEPSILFVEMINEPQHHSKDLQGSINYINALVDAVRSTGCKKILFHNVSQDFNISEAMQKSKIQGASFAWYPSGLNASKTLSGNYLPVVDDYSLMLKPELSKLAKIVYEFDHPDQLTGYMYPAMVRTFRSVGTQFATMFSYDMLSTAAYNLGWQTHYLNMVYTPKKAVSSIIAAEVMKNLPRLKSYGSYPSNTSFGEFKISYDQDLSEMNTAEKFMYSNTTKSKPVNASTLKKIVGYGSSPVVNYEGNGIYFLDKINDGTWRLEVYPDAVIVDDPFKMPSPGKVVSRIINRNWPMAVSLPDLGNTFNVIPINETNSYVSKTSNSQFNIQPGVFILTSDKNFTKESLPKQIGFIGVDEFVSPANEQLAIRVLSSPPPEVTSGKPVLISANVYSESDPASVTLYVKQPGTNFMPVQMKRENGYTYKAELPSNRFSEGWMEYCVVVKDKGKTFNFPSGINKSPGDWDFYGSETWKFKVVKPIVPIRLLNPVEDVNRLAFTRIGDNIRFGIFKMLPASNSGDAAFRLELPLSYDKNLEDYTLSIPVKEKLVGRRDDLQTAKAIQVNVKGISEKQEAYITLVEKDGTSWSKKLELANDWNTSQISLNDLELSKGVMLPLGYPGNWRYWFVPANGRGSSSDKIRIQDIEWLQISIRPSTVANLKAESNSWVEISSASLIF